MKKPIAETKYYTPAEVAEILKVSRQTIYNYLTAGTLKASKVGRSFRISEENLQDLVKSKE